ncbi:MAG: ABC transporter substrate-binding protein [Parasporobacterium sp.]|nr:ABC transporter substrate-binding protein [Parasporobacterium sp.]
MKKKNIFRIILAAVLALSMVALAACGGSGNDTPATQGGEAAPATGDKVIKIGATGPLTGEASSYGISVQQGAQLALEEINSAGGVDGYTFDFNILDDKAAAVEAGTNYDALVDWGMNISIGAVTTGAGEAFGKKAAEDGLFFITPSGSGDSVIATGDTAFRLCFGDPDNGILSAEKLAAEYENIGVIYDVSDAYSAGIYEAFEGKMKELGKEFTVRDFNADNKKDFSAQVEALKDCDVIFLPFYYTEASLVARELMNKELNDIDLFGCDGLDGLKPLLDEGVQNSIKYLSPFDVNGQDTLTADFVANYTAKYGAAPDQFAADGYDAIYIIAEIFKQAGVPENLSIENVGKLATETLTSSAFSYKGVTGDMQWEASGACNKAPIIVTLN